jgi:hypothetical protein
MLASWSSADHPVRQAEAVLAAVQPCLMSEEQIELRCIHPERGKPPVRRFYHSYDALHADAARFRAVYHCYFGVALRRHAGGTAAHVSRAGACWADIDAKLWAGAPQPKQSALQAIEAFSLRPTVVVDSGGGFQLYWSLDPPVVVRELYQRNVIVSVNAALARSLCGPHRTPDHVHDVARVLRLPGSLNHKLEYVTPRPVSVVWCEPHQRYDLDELLNSLRDQWPWSLASASAPARNLTRQAQPVGSPTALSSTLSPQRPLPSFRARTQTLLHSTGADNYQSASEGDAAAAAALIGEGCSTAEALRVLVTSERGRDALERKGRHGEAYWQRTVDRAASYVGEIVGREDGLRTRLVSTIGRLRTGPALEVRRWPH